MATLTGLEPATSTVTGWRASDCSTGPASSGEGLNLRPPLYQSGALDRLSYRTWGTPCGTRTRSPAVKEQETNPYPNGAWVIGAVGTDRTCYLPGFTRVLFPVSYNGVVVRRRVELLPSG